MTKTYDEFGGGEKPLISRFFGNFGGDCPVLKSGRKGHTFKLIQIISYPRQYADANGIIMSVRPEPLPNKGLSESGLIFRLCETPGTV